MNAEIVAEYKRLRSENNLDAASAWNAVQYLLKVRTKRRLLGLPESIQPDLRGYTFGGERFYTTISQDEGTPFEDDHFARPVRTSRRDRQTHQRKFIYAFGGTTAVQFTHDVESEYYKHCRAQKRGQAESIYAAVANRRAMVNYLAGWLEDTWSYVHVVVYDGQHEIVDTCGRFECTDDESISDFILDAIESRLRSKSVKVPV